MSELLYYTLVFPLEGILGFLLDWLFGIAKSYGLSIIILSLFVNIFLLKIFILTDKKAEFEAERKKRLDSRIKAWKSVYKKAKLFAFTQTLYRQNRYHPIYALSALGGLAVQIPFFYAMYFVVKNADIKGVSFLWISDLSAPDLIFGVHLLPILMTIISLVNVWIVAKEKGARIQGIAIAIIFLVLLYKMPSALVLYWTSNMAFSLARAVIAKWRKGNSSLGTPFALGGNFGEQQTQKSSFIPKISSKYKTSTANTRIYDSSKSDSSDSTESKHSPSLAEGARGWVKSFFILRKPLKIAMIALTAILTLLLCATFAFHSTQHSAKLKFIGGSEAQIDYAINALLRSKSMSAGVEIVGVKWDSSIDSSAIQLIGNAQRAVNFYSAKPLNLKKGAHLGQVQFKLDLSPLFKNLFIYYFAILGAVLGIYLLLCIIYRFQAYRESHLKSYKNISLYAILCIAFLICVFTPYQLYSTDITQFDFAQTYATLSALFGAFMLCSFIAIYVVSFIPKRFSNFVAFILSVVLFSGIAYSFILVGDYGAMDHFILQRAPESSALQLIEFIAVAALAIVLVAFTLTKLMRVWQIAFATLFVVSGVNATSIVLKHTDSANMDKIAESSSDSALDSATNVDSTHSAPPQPPYENELFTYSKTHKNIVVIVLDAFSGSHTPYILEQFPHFKEQLDGFLLFPNTISTTNSTIHSIATLLGGEYYAVYNMNKRKQNLAQEIDKAFINTANAFAGDDFSVSLMAFVGSKIDNINAQTHPAVFALDTGSRAFLNYYIRQENLFETIKANTAKNSKYILPAQLSAFGLFKFAPKPLHPSIYNDGLWLFDTKSHAITAIGYAATFYAPTHILSVDSAKPTFKYFHSMMTHTPYGMYFNNDKCEFFSDKSAFADYPHKARIENAHQHFDTEACALKYLTHFVANLKNLGIYDNTQIFVVSDHGGTGPINIPISSRPDALLLFKDFGAKGALREDNRLMANYDIASIFCANLKNGCPSVGQNILAHYPQNREIIHTIPSAWQLARHRKNEWYITKAYKVRKDIYNAKNWTDISDSKYGIVNVR